MLVNTQAGRCYSPKEIKSWLSKAELKNIREVILDDTILVTGTI
jgi:hypothetical protein